MRALLAPWFDRALAVGCVLVLIADALAEGRAQAHLLPSILLCVATCVPLLWRRSQPLGSLVAAMVGLIACAVVLHTGAGSIAVALVPLYLVSARGGRRRSIVIAGVMTLVLATTTVVVESSIDYRTGAARLFALIGALAIGDVVRTRRALRAEAADRATSEARERESDHQRQLSLERLRIARDVHDSIAHALVAINVRAGVAAHLGAASDALAALTEIKTVSADALGDLRATLGLLRNEHDVAPTAPAQGLDSLPQLLERTSNAGLVTRGDVGGLDGSIPMPVGQAGFRIVQESLTNVLRHAAASRADVRVRVRDGQLEIEVEDDGTGVPAATSGHGLRGMTERADALGGTLVAGPRTGGGWRVHARLPLAADAR